MSNFYPQRLLRLCQINYFKEISLIQNEGEDAGLMNHFINYCYNTKKVETKWDKESKKILDLIIWNTIMSWKGGPIQEWIQI